MRLATRGKPLAFRNILSSLAPQVLQYGVLMEEPAVRPACVQMVMKETDCFGQLNFLMNKPEVDETVLLNLLEQLMKGSGELGARWLLADLPVDSALLPIFRQANFNVWARQSLYQSPTGGERGKGHSWRTWTNADIPAMTNLHRSIVPKLFQIIEPLTRRTALGLVLFHEDRRLAGYADLDIGPQGIWAQPYFEPDVDDPQVLLDLVNAIDNPLKRPIYIAARSYQPWLQGMLEELDFPLDSEQALLVRYLAVRAFAGQTSEKAAYDSVTAERGLPVVRLNQDN